MVQSLRMRSLLRSKFLGSGLGNRLRRNLDFRLAASRNSDQRAGSVAQAIVAYGADDESAQSHMFRCPDDEQRRIPRLSDQYRSGVAAGELDQPIRAWVDLVEYRRHAGAVTRINFVEGQVPLRHTVEAWAAHPEWPTQHMHCAQHQASTPGMIRSPTQSGTS